MLLWVAAGLPGLAWGGAADRELVCSPSATGCVTTWLVAGPIGFLRAEELERDFLEAAGGEAKVQPRQGDVADPANALAWQALVAPTAVLD
ncbi:MAG TPA: hypothetical protein VNE39_03440, partial [Planctomycetota bacterium]|nr:hypothetical protein [Planctomycetota bacterium]